MLQLLAAAAAKSLQSCPTLWPHRRQPTRLPHPWDSPGKNTGVGCHFLLQCTKVKSESEVAQSCPTLSDPMDRSPPGSSIHGIFQARVLEWGAIAFSSVVLATENNMYRPVFHMVLRQFTTALGIDVSRVYLESSHHCHFFQTILNILIHPRYRGWTWTQGNHLEFNHKGNCWSKQ